MKGEIALLREALKDPSNTKFVFLSESTLPLATFPHAYEQLVSHPKSEISENLKEIADLRIFYKNSQWIVLNRKHAQLMVDEETYLDVFAEHCPVDDEHYPSNILGYQNLLEDEVVNHQNTLVIWNHTEGWDHPHLFEDLDTDPFFCYIAEAIKPKQLFARKFSPSCNLRRLHDYLPELYYQSCTSG